jgi:antitoxin (DNA-binding transcriptional repressor) of toxin-antitoxin stability system
MIRVELRDAKGSLSDYARKARRGPVVVMRGGKPIALLRTLTDEEWEDFVVSTHPGFLSVLERSRARYEAAGGISLAEIERRFGLTPKAARRRAKKPAPKRR